MTIEQLSDRHAGDWLWSFDRAAHRGTVAGLITDRFAAYCKVFHYCVEDLSDPATIASHCKDLQAGHYSSIDMAWMGQITRLLEGANEAPFPFRKLRLSEVARQQGLVFHAEFSYASLARRDGPTALWGPSEGVMPLDIAERLIALLALQTGAQRCYFYWALWPPGFPATDEAASQHVWRGALSDALAFADPDSQQFDSRAAEYWWPEDRSWCVCSNWDLTFTLVGASRAVIDALLADPLLETIEVTSETGTYPTADHLNLRP